MEGLMGRLTTVILSAKCVNTELGSEQLPDNTHMEEEHESKNISPYIICKIYCCE